MGLEFTPADWQKLDEALTREWILTNGLGGYAFSSLVGANTRCYHGLLVAATAIPAERTVLLSKIDEEITLDGQTFKLAVNEWASGNIEPRGDQYLEHFSFDYSAVIFRYRLGEHTLTKTVRLAYGGNAVRVSYRLEGPDQTANLLLRPLINNKDHHSEQTENTTGFDFVTLPDNGGFSYVKPGSSHELYFKFEDGTNPQAEWVGGWVKGVHHRAETERGLPDTEDLFIPHLFRLEMKAGQEISLIASLGDVGEIGFDRSEREAGLLEMLPASLDDPALKELVLAADQFLVARPSVESVLPEGAKGVTVIAGYPWFTDWGRDTMIALSGLTLTTGRFEEAANILRTFAAYLDEGMLPNRFPDRGEAPEYNTVDATLWFFQAIYDYFQFTGDEDLVSELYPKLEQIIEWHKRGTRYGIRLDGNLLEAGAPGVQLTWMDAKVDDWVVTPRWGKPVEINALWCNALGIMSELSAFLGMRSQTGQVNFTNMYRETREEFNQRFWNEGAGYLYDVIDTTVDPSTSQIDGQRRDYSLRPNQLFAISLPFGPLGNLQDKTLLAKARQVVDICQKELLTPVGMRTLNRADKRYRAIFTGNQQRRDAAYHNGTVWPWLIGSLVMAHYRVYGDKEAAQGFLEPLVASLRQGGIGTLNEVYDADPPHRPLGCVAQAWSVAEVLRLWHFLSEKF